MTKARKRRIHEREGGVCWICNQPVAMEGPEVRYDHRDTLWITQSDDDATIFPIHRAGCDETKTPKDQSRIAKTKRQITMRVGAERKPTANPIRSRGFSDQHRPLQSRNTFATRKRP